VEGISERRRALVRHPRVHTSYMGGSRRVGLRAGSAGTACQPAGRAPPSSHKIENLAERARSSSHEAQSLTEHWGTSFSFPHMSPFIKACVTSPWRIRACGSAPSHSFPVSCSWNALRLWYFIAARLCLPLPSRSTISTRFCTLPRQRPRSCLPPLALQIDHRA